MPRQPTYCCTAAQRRYVPTGDIASGDRTRKRPPTEAASACSRHQYRLQRREPLTLLYAAPYGCAPHHKEIEFWSQAHLCPAATQASKLAHFGGQASVDLHSVVVVGFSIIQVSRAFADAIDEIAKARPATKSNEAFIAGFSQFQGQQMPSQDAC